jgi:hypothetical protein
VLWGYLNETSWIIVKLLHRTLGKGKNGTKQLEGSKALAELP